MQEQSLKKLLAEIKNVDISVIGDFCLDAYWFIDMKEAETSVETGLNTLPVSDQRYSLGGAGNVVNNLLGLGVRRINVFGVTGNDLFGREMRHIMRKNTAVQTSGLIVQNGNWDTHVYSKPYRNGNELSRIDFGGFNRLMDDIADELLCRLRKVLPVSRVVVINEQVASGIHRSDYFRQKLSDVIAEHPDNIFLLDSRSFCEAYPGTIRKINEHEAAQLCGVKYDRLKKNPRAESLQHAEVLGSRWNKELFVTRGERGCLLFEKGKIIEIPAVLFNGKTDTVGAGDSVLAGIGAALAAKADFAAAAELGNLVAGVTVRKLFQTGIATPDEVLEINRLLRRNDS